MESYGKPDFLVDGEVGKAAPSYSNFSPNYVIMDEYFDQVTAQFARQQYGPTGGTSSEVPPHLGNTYSPAGSDLSQNNLPRNGTGNPRMTAAIRAERKRVIDRAYRERLKQGKMVMKSTLETLYGENENLKKENERLQHEHDSMKETLQSQTKLINQLKSDLEKLTEEYKKQYALVQTLSGVIACPDLQLENERLKFENDQLRRNAGVDQKKLLEENGNLKLENKVLRVQNDALCGKLINDCDKKHV